MTEIEFLQVYVATDGTRSVGTREEVNDNFADSLVTAGKAKYTEQKVKVTPLEEIELQSRTINELKENGVSSVEEFYDAVCAGETFEPIWGINEENLGNIVVKAAEIMSN